MAHADPREEPACSSGPWAIIQARYSNGQPVPSCLGNIPRGRRGEGRGARIAEWGRSGCTMRIADISKARGAFVCWTDAPLRKASAAPRSSRGGTVHFAVGSNIQLDMGRAFIDGPRSLAEPHDVTYRIQSTSRSPPMRLPYNGRNSGRCGCPVAQPFGILSSVVLHTKRKS